MICCLPVEEKHNQVDMIKKTIIPLFLDEVAPRFDLATEVMIITTSGNNEVEEERTVVLAQASADKLCQLILVENIKTLICGAIEDEYYQFLKWKKIGIFDSVSGSASRAFEALIKDELSPGDVLLERQVEGRHV